MNRTWSRHFLNGRIGVGRALGPQARRFDFGGERYGRGETGGWLEVFGFWINFMLPMARRRPVC